MKNSLILLMVVFGFYTNLFGTSIIDKSREKREQVRLLISETDSLSKVNMLEALRKIEDAIYITSIYELDDLKGYVYYQKGKLLSIIGGNGGQGIDLFLRSLNISIKEGDVKLQIMSSTAIGHYYIKNKNVSKAEVYYKNTLKLSREFKDSILIGNAYINMGTLYANKNQLDSSLYYLEKSLPFFKDKHYTSGIKMNIGNVLRSMKQYDSSQKIYNAELISAKQNGDLYLCCMLYLNLAELYIKKRDFLGGKFMIDSAAKINNQLKSASIEQSILENEYENYKQQADYASANQYLERINKFIDSLNTNTLSYLRDRILINIENEKKENELMHQKRHLQFIVGLIIMVMLVFASLAFLYIQRNNLRRRRALLDNEKIFFEREQLEASVNIQKKELVGKTLMLAHQNETIEEVIGILDDGKKVLSKESQEKINDIIRRLSDTVGENFWREFDQYFGQIHRDFYTSLSEKHPGLSALDLRLCAFFKLKMSNKEIALITNRQIKAIVMARYRLRKKMGLDQTIDLPNYLSSF